MKTLLLLGLLSLNQTQTTIHSLPLCRPTDLQPISCESAVCICDKYGKCEWVGCV